MDNLNFANIRVRIAPSPTGFVHIGNLRTILYNYLFTKRYDGKFIVRIEDTDQSRKVDGAMEDLLQTIAWAGIETDEGPFINEKGKIEQKGENGPYIQSERLDIYKNQIQDLLDKNKAYYCFCDRDRLQALREQQKEKKQPPKYDNFCRDLNREEVESMLKSGAPYVIRFKMPENKEVVFQDEVWGTVKMNTADMDDFVLMKSDGFPTYHFASVVDDHFMKITHVMRGEEWIPSTPKHFLLYEAFGWQPPKFAHLPALLNKQKKKLSKRDGETSVKDFVESGYLKDALLNFIALLGWNAGTDQEIYTLNELTKQFSLDNVHKSGAVFDMDKLDWINGVYLRKLSADEFYEKSLPFLINADLISENEGKLIIKDTGQEIKQKNLKNILKLEQERVKKLGEIAEAVDYFFKKRVELEAKKIVWKKSNADDTLENLKKLEALLAEIDEEDFKEKILEQKITELMEKNNIGTGDMLWPMRYALTGRDKSPGPFEVATAMGKDLTLLRINSAIAELLSK